MVGFCLGWWLLRLCTTCELCLLLTISQGKMGPSDFCKSLSFMPPASASTTVNWANSSISRVPSGNDVHWCLWSVFGYSHLLECLVDGLSGRMAGVVSVVMESVPSLDGGMRLQPPPFPPGF